MGSSSTGVNVVFDTGNLGLAVQGSSCTTDCASTVYDETSSGNYSTASTPWTNTYKTSQQPAYWINVTGIEAQDSVSFDSDTVNPLQFYLIESMSMTSGDSFTPENTGWLGLTLNNEAAAVTTFDFIEQLSTAGVLSAKNFGLHISYETGTSFVDFGAFQSSSLKSGVSSTVSLELKGDTMKWETQLDGIRFGDDAKWEWGFDSYFA